jgi:hypothetical protein
MFDFYKEFDKQWQEAAKHIKQVNHFWIDVIADTLKMYKAK